MEAYIDESGDRGTANHGTRWLTFGCAMVAGALVAKANNDIHSIALRCSRPRKHGASVTPPPPIHFKQMTHQNRRGVYDLFVRTMPYWTGSIVSTDTTKIQRGSWLVRPTYQYNYALRYMVERVSWYAALLREPATIYIEKSRSFDLMSFKRYLGTLQGRSGASRVDWSYVHPERIFEAHRTSCNGLALADGLAHAGFKALEPNKHWGMCEIEYLDMVNPRLWRDADPFSVWQKGFVLMPTPAWSVFNQEYSWFDALREVAPLR